jgi:dihydroorotate dehydrogenase electron transfer subunit
MSTTASPDRGSFLARVASVRVPCREHFELALALPAFPPAMPGQFLQVLCRTSSSEAAPPGQPGEDGPLLRRPFSIAGLRTGPGGVEIDLLGRIVGQATAWLAARRGGDAVDILGPLGTPFSAPPPGGRAMLVAGGIGLPPIRWLGETLAARGVRCEAIYGAQSRDLLAVRLAEEPRKTGEMTPCAAEFAARGIGTCITTDDGSCGLRGRVTEALRMHLQAGRGERPCVVYACGPERMLEGVAAICGTAGVACQVAMERVMGCGLATCQSCVVPVKDAGQPEGWRYALCCSEGPVFDASRVKWG